MSTSSSADRDAQVTAGAEALGPGRDEAACTLCPPVSSPAPMYEERKLGMLESKDPTRTGLFLFSQPGSWGALGGQSLHQSRG